MNNKITLQSINKIITEVIFEGFFFFKYHFTFKSTYWLMKHVESKYINSLCLCVSVCVCRIHTLTIRSCVPSGEMMVPLSPTSDGRVWDIQLVTIAMVLSTAPIFNMGTLILTCTHSQAAQKNRSWSWISHTVQTVDSSHDESGVTGRRSACSRVFSSTFSYDFTLLLMSALLQRTASG